MAQRETVTIERLELRLTDLNRIKQLFKLEDNAEAVRKAMEVAAGKIELEAIFRKYEGTVIEKQYD